LTHDRSKLAAMTTNERLFETGQMEAFEATAAAGDLKKTRSILESIYLDEPSIRLIEDDIRARRDRLRHTM
jgi:hypothetical protein